MGIYINPSDRTKEAWLIKYGTPVSPAIFRAFEFDANPDTLPVCLVNNGAFTAAAVGYDVEERDAFTPTPFDMRLRTYFLVPKAALIESGGVTQRELDKYTTKQRS